MFYKTIKYITGNVWYQESFHRKYPHDPQYESMLKPNKLKKHLRILRHFRR